MLYSPVFLSPQSRLGCFAFERKQLPTKDLPRDFSGGLPDVTWGFSPSEAADPEYPGDPFPGFR